MKLNALEILRKWVSRLWITRPSVFQFSTQLRPLRKRSGSRQDWSRRSAALRWRLRIAQIIPYIAAVTTKRSQTK